MTALSLGIEQAARLAAQLRADGSCLVFTNGCFDLLHRGHVDYLQRARALGDFLFVGLNGDDSVRRLKGAGRPLMPEEDRVAVVAALRCVDAVVVFDGPTAEQLVAAIRPDIYVKGSDWGSEDRQPPEAAVVASYGGRVEYLAYVPGRSTTELLEHIRQATGREQSYD